MATSIPADSSLIMGHLVDPRRIEFVKKIAEAVEPQILEEENLNDLILSFREIASVYTDLKNMEASPRSLDTLQKELSTVKRKMAKSAIQLGRVTIASQIAVNDLHEQQGQSLMHIESNSPLDFVLSEVTKLPLSFDSMKMDVQFFHNEENIQGTMSHAATIAAHVGKEFSGLGSLKLTSNLSNSSRAAVLKQTDHYQIEGTIVISAHCTHKNSIVIDPFILDPVKAVSTWNNMYPSDIIRTDPESIFKTALTSPASSKKDKDKALHIISGAGVASSFIGMVHVLKIEGSHSSQKSIAAMAQELQSMMTKFLSIAELSGDDNLASDFARSAKELLSRGELSNHCTLLTEGVTPRITSSTMKTSVKRMKPDTKEIMSQLDAIKSANKAGMGSTAKVGQQFMALNGDHTSNTVSALSSYDAQNNKNIDVNSMMTAFTNYIQQVNEGDVGVPVNFSIRNFYKRDIAMGYISKYYANGAATQKETIAGQTRNTISAENN